jgi:hypothetical protein
MQSTCENITGYVAIDRRLALPWLDDDDQRFYLKTFFPGIRTQPLMAFLRPFYFPTAVQPLLLPSDAPNRLH